MQLRLPTRAVCLRYARVVAMTIPPAAHGTPGHLQGRRTDARFSSTVRRRVIGPCGPTGRSSRKAIGRDGARGSDELLAQADQDHGLVRPEPAAPQGSSPVRRAEQRGQEHAVEQAQSGQGPSVREDDRAHRRVHHGSVRV